jgi:glycosyltransferase involved in cell wall biosynthesis
VFVHSSDELYGADRILLDLYEALPPSHRERAEFWLPTDVPHGATPLCAELQRRGATGRHLALPVLRRAYRTPRALAGLARRWVRLVRELRRARPAFVYCSTSATLTAAPAARLAGVPRVVGHVQEIWTPGDARVLTPLGRACQTLVAISEPVRAALPALLRERTTVVHNATPEPERVVPLDGRQGGLRFVVASRWNAWKGHRTLLAAWDRLDDPGELVVLGGPPPSGEATDVRALAAALAHPDSVRVVGEVPDARPHLDDADVVVVPSDQPEPFGLVAVEAFARARPVVASAGGGLADIVTDGVDGWLFPPGDVEALSRVLAGLDRERVTAAGARARATYERRYTAERYASQWRLAVGLSEPS